MEKIRWRGQSFADGGMGGGGRPEEEGRREERGFEGSRDKERLKA